MQLGRVRRARRSIVEASDVVRVHVAVNGVPRAAEQPTGSHAYLIAADCSHDLILPASLGTGAQTAAIR
jgi:hypothetical protein